MIESGIETTVVVTLRDAGLDPRQAWVGRGDDGVVRAWPAAAANAADLPSLEAHGPVRVTSVLEPVRGEPAHGAESITEIRAGEHLTGLLRRDDWWVVAGEDGYVGWVHDWVIEDDDLFRRRADAERWIGRYRRPLGTLWIADHHAGQPLVLGTPMLRPDAELVSRADWRLVETPTGAQGWIPDDDLETTTDATPGAALRRARELLGVPYRWGGRSPLGFDCSGFVQFVFGAGGVALPRDASQQQHVGDEVGLPREGWQPGDVLFFGDPADHVGIFDGKRSLIHCRASVVKQPLDRLGDLLERLSGVRRVTPMRAVTTSTLWIREPDAPDA